MDVVDWIFFLSQSNCHFSVAIDVPNDVEKWISSIPGHVMNLSLLMLLVKEETTGEIAQPCKYVARSDFD